MFLSVSGNQAAAGEVKALFSGNTVTPKAESFATRAEHLCNRVLSSMSSQTPRRYRRSISHGKVREWKRNVVLIDWQGDEEESVPLYDHQKLFDGLMNIVSTMCEIDVRNEIVRLVKLKTIPTHRLDMIMPDLFDFVKVYNRRVRPLDGDVSLDANGLIQIYKHGNIYVRLVDSSLWCTEQVGVYHVGSLLSYVQKLLVSSSAFIFRQLSTLQINNVGHSY